MPLFDLTTNVKEVPENFHKETTELVAQLLGKPSTGGGGGGGLWVGLG